MQPEFFTRPVFLCTNLFIFAIIDLSTRWQQRCFAVEKETIEARQQQLITTLPSTWSQNTGLNQYKDIFIGHNV